MDDVISVLREEILIQQIPPESPFELLHNQISLNESSMTSLPLLSISDKPNDTQEYNNTPLIADTLLLPSLTAIDTSQFPSNVQSLKVNNTSGYSFYPESPTYPDGPSILTDPSVR
jgi:hypothetical protein